MPIKCACLVDTLKSMVKTLIFLHFQSLFCRKYTQNTNIFVELISLVLCSTVHC